MVKVRYGPNVIGIMGSIYEMTFDKCRTGGNFIRHRVRTKYEERPLSKTKIRQAVGQAAKDWLGKLTDAERATWNMYRGAYPNGYTFYLATCAILASAGFTVFPTTPPLKANSPSAPSIVKTWLTLAGRKLRVWLVPPAVMQPGARVVIWGKSVKSLYQKQIITTGPATQKYFELLLPLVTGKGKIKQVPGLKWKIWLQVINPDGTVSPVTPFEETDYYPGNQPWDDITWDTWTWG